MEEFRKSTDQRFKTFEEQMIAMNQQMLALNQKLNQSIEADQRMFQALSSEIQSLKSTIPEAKTAEFEVKSTPEASTTTLPFRTFNCNPKLEFSTFEVFTTIASETFDESPKKGKLEVVTESELNDKTVGKSVYEVIGEVYEIHDIDFEVALDAVSPLVGTGEEIFDGYEVASEKNELTEKYGVQGFPTTFVDGVYKSDTGQRTKDGLVTWIEKKIGPGSIYNINTAYGRYQLNIEIVKFDSSHDWGGVGQATSELIKANIEPILEQYRPMIVLSMKFCKLTLGIVVPQSTGVFIIEYGCDVIESRNKEVLSNPEFSELLDFHFSQLSALLSGIGLNIREAHMFSTTDGYSLDVFVVEGAIKASRDLVKWSNVSAKRLIGRRFNDALVQSDMKLWFPKFVAGPDDNIGLLIFDPGGGSFVASLLKVIAVNGKFPEMESLTNYIPQCHYILDNSSTPYALMIFQISLTSFCQLKNNIPSAWKPVFETLSKEALECLVRLASVRRSLFSDDVARSKFVAHLMTGTKEILQTWQWASSSVYYLLALGIWSRLMTSVPCLKSDAPNLLDEFVPKIIEGFITSRFDSVQAGFPHDLSENSLDNVGQDLPFASIESFVNLPGRSLSAILSRIEPKFLTNGGGAALVHLSTFGLTFDPGGSTVFSVLGQDC